MSDLRIPKSLTGLVTHTHLRGIVADIVRHYKSLIHNAEQTFSAALDNIDGSMQQVLNDCNNVKQEIYDERDRIFTQFDQKAEQAKQYADEQIERIQAEEATIAAIWNDLDARMLRLENGGVDPGPSESSSPSEPSEQSSPSSPE